MQKDLSPQQRKFLLALPLLALPFFCLVFTSLKGGKAVEMNKDSTTSGLNPELPGANFDHNKTLLNKINSYQEAELDSQRRKELLKRDPYHSGSLPAQASTSDSTQPHADPKADQLLQQLDRLRESLHQPGPTPVIVKTHSSIYRQRSVVPPDTPEDDPQLAKLNSMLDKVIRIQHPGESRTSNTAPTNTPTDEVLPADSSANAIPAVIPEDQTVVTGATVSLRLTGDILVNRLRIPKGQVIYGQATISNDRLQIHISAIRYNLNIYTTDLHLYDMDGIPGIRIPGLISRDVAKASADQGVSGLTLATIDPSLGAQAANAGVQAAKSFFSRKVRLTRVSVRAGYQVLLRNNHPGSATRLPYPAPVHAFKDEVQPPGFVPGGSFLQRSRAEGLELTLQEICLKDSLLWFALQLENHSPISYNPDYVRWFIRDQRQFKRTALQELPVDPSWSPPLQPIPGDSTCRNWTGFRPFALAKDKQLILEIGEGNGGRVLTLTIDHKKILKAKKE